MSRPQTRAADGDQQDRANNSPPGIDAPYRCNVGSADTGQARSSRVHSVRGTRELPGSTLEGVGLGVGTAGTPLIPVLPISTEPIGIPARLAPPGEMAEGDDRFMVLPLVKDVPTQG